MPRHNAYRSRGVESVGGELSSGQLGIGIAVAIVFGLVCFILGYVVANVEQPIQDITATSGEGAAAKPVGAPNDGATPPGTAKPAAQQPNPSESPAPVAQRPTQATTPSGPSANATQRNPAGRTGVEALPTPGGPIPMVKRPINLGTTGGTSAAPATGGSGTAPATGGAEPATSGPPPIVPPSNSAPVEEAPATVASNSGGTPAPTTSTTPEPAAKPPAVKPPPSAPTVSRGSYGVQVAAFNGPRRAEQASEARKKLKESTGLDAEIVKTADGAYEKVIVTGFATPEAAKAQCEKLKEKADYASSWVVPVR